MIHFLTEVAKKWQDIKGKVGKDLFPYLKVPLDVGCLGMKLNHSTELPTIYNERFLFLLYTNVCFLSQE